MNYLKRVFWANSLSLSFFNLKINDFRPWLLEKEPSWSGSVSTTSQGHVHYILHQWDRIPDWHNAIETLYG